MRRPRTPSRARPVRTGVRWQWYRYCGTRVPGLYHMVLNHNTYLILTDTLPGYRFINSILENARSASTRFHASNAMNSELEFSACQKFLNLKIKISGLA